jgi:hypothetical protein
MQRGGFSTKRTPTFSTKPAVIGHQKARPPQFGQGGGHSFQLNAGSVIALPPAVS